MCMYTQIGTCIFWYIYECVCILMSRKSQSEKSDRARESEGESVRESKSESERK